MTPEECNEMVMCRFHVSCSNGSRSQVAVESYIDDEVQASEVRCGQHLFVNRVSVEDSRSRRSAAEHVKLVVADNGLVSDHRRQNRLSPAGESGKLMWLHLAECDAQVSFGYASIEEDGRTASSATDIHEVRRASIVTADSQSICPLGTQQVNNLIRGRRAMDADANDHLHRIG